METPKRISLNTTLKNAKIFEYSSEDSSEPLLTFQDLIKESQMKSASESLNNKQPDPYNSEQLDLPIKQENIKIESEHNSFSDNCDITMGKQPDHFNSEQLDLPIKQENIKMEFEHNSSSDNCDIAMGKLGLQTPIKNEDVEESLNKSNLKSAKRTLLKQRNSPYSKNTNSEEKSKKVGNLSKMVNTKLEGKKTKKRDLSCGSWDEEVDNKMMRGNDDKKGEKKFETDPVVLERRQKQIDFGKNTIGYDNYIKQVPKDKRTAEDPVTPNKYRVYSRRGFDGLIRQWRLKLHKYDP